MRVALIDPSLFTWPYDAALAKGLAENGHEVLIYGRDPAHTLPSDEQHLLVRHFYPGFSASFMRRLPKPFFLGLKGLSHVESMGRLLRVLKRLRPDAIHFQWTPLAVVDQRFIPAFRRIAPTVLTVHDSTPFNDNPKAGLQRLGAMEIMKQFDQLIVHTEAARVRLATHGITRGVNIVPHGLLLNPQKSSPYAVSAGKKVNLLIFGQIKPYKGIDVLLHALALLPVQVREKCVLNIVGKPHMPIQQLIAMVGQLGLEQQVRFDLRFVPDEEVGGLMASADIQLFPYRAIDASGVLMLALAVGRAIIASDLGLFGEILKSERHGALVPPDDPQALAGALETLIVDDAKRLAAATEVKALAASIPTWNSIARMTEDVYRTAALGL